MKFFAISDNIDTITGLRLAGIKGIVVHERAEVIEALEKAVEDNDIGIIIMTELLAEMLQDEVKEIRLDATKPIITIIPDRHGERRRPDYITNYIKESIGLKI
ncbi:MAG: Archaeal/vacuolar-type H+-ATPase subunit [Clostridia bacterium]|jgi:V/A-type H+-transporting ATPase subunit F|nr:Archaeal/vacuolar-type H+-ATPase subunit [Clostridia bacterium]MDF2891985.1 Archaeal/vacuolar-type H+-ATPase subunit [Clostridia bacterium]